MISLLLDPTVIVGSLHRIVRINFKCCIRHSTEECQANIITKPTYHSLLSSPSMTQLSSKLISPFPNLTRVPSSVSSFSALSPSTWNSIWSLLLSSSNPLQHFETRTGQTFSDCAKPMHSVLPIGNVYGEFQRMCWHTHSVDLGIFLSTKTK